MIAKIRIGGAVMNRFVKTSIKPLLVLTLITGCQALTGKTVGRNIDDATLTTWVKTQLVKEKTMNLTRVSVKTDNGVVYLTGTVESALRRERAENIAWKVKGVKDVVNHLVVQKP